MALWRRLTLPEIINFKNFLQNKNFGLFTYFIMTSFAAANLTQSHF